MEAWKERTGITPTREESQSVDNQGHGTVIHVEMRKEQQNTTIDKGQREGTTETKHHVRMWEGRHTPKDASRKPIWANNYPVRRGCK